MKQSLISIGTTEEIELPDYQLGNIPAKIDTGADSSSIWASNVYESNGELHFTLFGLSSPYYTGDTIKTKKYSVVNIKNSFGHREDRYRVEMRLKLAGRVIKVKITLANRGNNRFPVLIGKRTLRGKFIVDVSKASKLMSNQKVLMLVNKKTDSNAAFETFLKGEAINVERVAYDDLTFTVERNKSRITINSSSKDVSEYGLVYFQHSNLNNLNDRTYVAATIAQYLDNRRIDYLDRSVNQCPDPPKLYQYVALADSNISVPKSIFMMPDKLAQSYEKLVGELGFPFILKDNYGRKGKHVYLISSKEEFDHAIFQCKDLGIWLLAQQYIPNDFYYRLIVMGAQVAVVIKRIRSNESIHAKKVFFAGEIELVDIKDIPASLTNLAVAAAKLLHLQIAGADIIQDKNTKLWYCLEVNKAPQIYTGAFPDEKQAAIAKYLSHRLSG